jgi:hypothetical protein
MNEETKTESLLDGTLAVKLRRKVMRDFFEVIRDYPVESSVLGFFIYCTISAIFRKDD